MRTNKRTVSERVGDRVADGGVPYVLLNPGSGWHGLYSAFRQSQAFVPLYDAPTRRFRPPQMPRMDNVQEREELPNVQGLGQIGLGPGRQQPLHVPGRRIGAEYDHRNTLRHEH